MEFDKIEKMIMTIGILVCIIGTIFIVYSNLKENTEIHSDDIKVTEWVSPDGVHYWYHDFGYGIVLTPRYDANGNLIIDK